MNMLLPKHFLSAFLILLLCSCRSNNKYPYAIKDFRKKLQPDLQKIVGEGIVMGRPFGNIVTDKELNRLSQSEHPVLRATAFAEMHDRKTSNYFDIMMGHLDDTAQILMDAGEFGIWSKTVSDYILQEAFTWETDQARNRTINEVLTKHNYLRSAYTILWQLEPQEKYYTYIKDMAIRPRHLDRYGEGYELGFEDKEYAFYGLAKFKKKEDIKILKNQMMRHPWRLSYRSFRLMTEFPDTAYFEVLHEYYYRQFYDFSGNRRDGFSGITPDRAEPEDFIKALVMQQDERSAKLLDTILTRLPLLTCMPDKEDIINETIKQIWDHPCPAYKSLRKKIKSRVEEFNTWDLTINPEAYKELIDALPNKKPKKGIFVIKQAFKPNTPDTLRRNIRWND